MFFSESAAIHLKIYLMNLKTQGTRALLASLSFEKAIETETIGKRVWSDLQS